MRRIGVAAMVVATVLALAAPVAAQDYPGGSGSPPSAGGNNFFPSTSPPGISQAGSSARAGTVNHLPSAVGLLVSAISHLPSAFSHLPSALGNLPSALGLLPSHPSGHRSHASSGIGLIVLLLLVGLAITIGIVAVRLGRRRHAI